MKPPHSLLAGEVIISPQSTFLVLNILRVKRPLVFHSHLLYVLLDAKLVPFSDTLLEFADVMFEKPLHSFRPRAFQLLGGRLQISL